MGMTRTMKMMNEARRRQALRQIRIVDSPTQPALHIQESAPFSLSGLEQSTE